VRISDEEREEMLALSLSEDMRKDLATVASNRRNTCMIDGEVSGELVTEFLTQYNEMLNHTMKPFRPFIESNMRL
jgi:hypothetical protein